jgi:flagellar brake protein
VVSTQARTKDQALKTDRVAADKPSMPFLDTQPADIDSLDMAGPWARFRVHDPRKQLATLREICRTDRPVTLGAPGGTTLGVTLWSVDDFNGRLHFKVGPDVAAALEITRQPDLWAAAYVEDAKVQFALPVVMLSNEGGASVLVADAPRLMYHLPRRRAVRVRRDQQQAPTVRFRHPLQPELITELKLLDISTSGCALWRPDAVMPLLPGMDLKKVEVELDDHTIVFSDLCVQHATLVPSPGGGTRVGCAWRGMPAPAQQRLNEWIQGGRRNRELISLSFD